MSVTRVRTRPTRTATILLAIVVAALTLVGPAQSSTGERERARVIGTRIVALYKTPAGFCKLGTVAGDPCTPKVKAELAPLFRMYAAEIRALSLRGLREVAPHRFRSALGTFAGKPFSLTLRKSKGSWQLLDEDSGKWFTIPAWLAW